MSLLDRAIELLSQPPGSLIYHFGILFAVEATLGIALGYRQRRPIRRVAVAAGGMLVGRLALMILALADYQGLVATPAAILPPLEHAVDAMGVWLLIWALLPLFDQKPQWGDLLSGGVSLLLLVLYLFFAVGWHAEATSTGATYNTSFQQTVWEMIQLGLLAAAGVHTVLDRRGDWTLRLGVLAVLLTAHVAQFGWAPAGDHVNGWGRLGQLAAYPLLTVSTYRLVVGRLQADAARRPVRSAADFTEQAKQLGAICGALDETAIIQAAVTATAAITGADAVALLMLVGSQELERASAFRDGKLVPWSQERVELEDFPPLQRAINHKQPTLLQPGGVDDSTRLALLTQLSPETGLKAQAELALYVQPVYQDDRRFGALLVQPTAGVDDWLARSRGQVDLLAEQLGAALARARTFRRLRSQANQLGDRLEQMDAKSAEWASQLRGELDVARRAVQDLARQLGLARREAARAQQYVYGIAVLLKDRPAQPDELAALVRLGDERRARIAASERQLEALTLRLDKVRAVVEDDGTRSA